MFSLVTGLYQAYFAPPHMNLLIVGAQGSGKTTLLERIKVTHFDPNESAKAKDHARHTTSGGKTEIYQRPQPLAGRGLVYFRGAAKELKSPESPQPPGRTTISTGVAAPPPPVLLETPRTKRILTKVEGVMGGSGGAPAAGGDEQASKSATTSNARRNWLCPATRKYTQASKDDDDEEEVETTAAATTASLILTPKAAAVKQLASPITPLPPFPSPSAASVAAASAAASASPHSPFLPALPGRSMDLDQNNRCTSASSMESVELSSEELQQQSGTTTPVKKELSASLLPRSSSAAGSTTATTIKMETIAEHHQHHEPSKELQLALHTTNHQKEEYDVKPGSKMLPLVRIRPTIGMNLGKVDICGAKCRVWDLGGRLQDLWERYYQDCDAVIFVWKLTEPPTTNNNDNDNDRDKNREQPLDGDEDDSDDERPEITAHVQQQILEQVRGSVPDDVPFLVLGHFFSGQGGAGAGSADCQPEVLYSTAQVLPHYHNPCQALFFANAATGQGLRSAMEWLIPLAKRQLRVRERMFDREK